MLASDPSSPRQSGWAKAVDILQSFLKRPRKLDDLFDGMAEPLDTNNRRRCQSLVMGAVRHLTLLQHAISHLTVKPPRPRLRALLLVAGFELLDDDSAKYPLIVDQAVGQARSLLSLGESKMANAVLRRFREVLADPFAGSPAPSLADRWSVQYSHPAWLVNRWLVRHGESAVESLLRWNQQPPPLYLNYWGSPFHRPPGLLDTPWPGFFEIAGPWADVGLCLRSGDGYCQDPFTRLPLQLLDAQPGENVLDVCAAPGGKSVHLARRLVGSSSRLVCLDLPGARLDLLRTNLRQATQTACHVMEADFLQIAPADLAAQNLPVGFPAVMLDAPCTNTGVLRRRPDAKWRLSERAVQGAARLQDHLLAKAAEFTAPGGRLVYSTCSLEPEENERQIERFIRTQAGRFALQRTVLSWPWQQGHDGGGAFLLQRL